MTTAPPPARTYKYYDLVMAAFVTVLLCGNLIGASKVATLFGFTFGAGVLFFPISYVFGDVLTEVYGYARARRVVWAGFLGLIFAAFMSACVLAFPPAPGWPHQAAFETVLGGTWRIVGASLVAYFCGEFCNSFVLAKMKILTSGRLLWMRTIGSTIAGELVDSLVFYPLAFYGCLAQQSGAAGPLHQLLAQGGLGGRDDALHLPRRQLPEARRARGLLRPDDGLHSVLPEDVALFYFVAAAGFARAARASSSSMISANTSKGRAPGISRPLMKKAGVPEMP